MEEEMEVFVSNVALSKIFISNISFLTQKVERQILLKTSNSCV
jgi:hypothetical protein